MSLYLSWTIEGEQQLSRRLQGIEAGLQNWEPSFKEASDMLTEIFSTSVFETEGGAIQETWSPLSRAYAKQKEKKYPGKGILDATGTMKGSFKNIFDSTSAEVWNAADYFKYHQSNQPRTKMPRRVMMKLTENMRQSVVKIFQAQFNKTINS